MHSPQRYGGCQRFYFSPSALMQEEGFKVFQGTNKLPCLLSQISFSGQTIYRTEIINFRIMWVRDSVNVMLSLKFTIERSHFSLLFYPFQNECSTSNANYCIVLMSIHNGEASISIWQICIFVPRVCSLINLLLATFLNWKVN